MDHLNGSFKVEERDRRVIAGVMQCEKRLGSAGFEGGRRRPLTKEHRQPLHWKRQGDRTSLEPPEGNAALQDVDFSPGLLFSEKTEGKRRRAWQRM